MATLAFVCAMPMELKPLTKPLGLEKTTIGEGPGSRGTLDGRDIVAIVTGMGTERAAAGMARLLRAVTPSRVVVVGIAGAVDDDIAIGTVVRPARVIDHDTGREHVHHLLGPGETAGALWTTGVMTPPSDLPGLIALGVIALDMETAAIAQACEAVGVPWTVFRAISDRATEGGTDDEVFHLAKMDGTPDPKAIARYVLRHPGKIPGMAKMGKDATLATKNAAAAAISAVRSTR